jgi:hypothetical protein
MKRNTFPLFLSFGTSHNDLPDRVGTVRRLSEPQGDLHRKVAKARTL